MLDKIKLPPDLSYESHTKDNPFEFYYDCLTNSKSLDLRLGYFSTNAIRVLAYGFAQFIHKGGKVRVITNHFLSQSDKELLVNEEKVIYDINVVENLIEKNVDNLAQVFSNGEQHFFDCLSFLLRNNRLIIQPVILKPGNMSHYKQGVFSDGTNQLYFNGSSNFTANGIVENGESIDLRRSWGADFEKYKVNNFKRTFEEIISREDKKYIYLDPSDVTSVIYKKSNKKDLNELLDDGQKILKEITTKDEYLKDSIIKAKINFKNFIRNELELPTFPFDEPRPYQITAKENWVENGKAGIFAMATGTGKTITSLNCLLEEYRESKNSTYQALILVPTQTLVNQWEEEVRSFNFKRIIKVSSQYKWRNELTNLLSRSKYRPLSFVVITTYASFISQDFLKLVKEFPEGTLLIADEAHNIGARSIKKAFKKIKLKKRIALSATPKRVYDPEGTKEIERFFSDEEPYTYSFSMKQAIELNYLCDYYYYPHIVNLTATEFEKYNDLTTKIGKAYVIDSNIESNERLKILLNQRKRIVHQASRKLNIAQNILTKRYEDYGSLKHSFVYVPEGSQMIDAEKEIYKDEEEVKIIDEYVKMIDDISNKLLVNRIVSGMKNREEILEQFKLGEIDVITSMKCLDEGVDIPEARFALFCSSTGNPRQFIQRRGRVLRKYKEKIAEIHDLVVTANVDNNNEDAFRAEKTLFASELKRVLYFSSLSLNPNYSFEVFEELSSYYDINMYKIFNELEQ